ATTPQEQALFVGIRSTFYRLATIGGQGLLVILAGVLQSHTGLPRVDVQVQARPGAPLVRQMMPQNFTKSSETALRVLASSPLIEISTEARSNAEINTLVAAAKESNTK